MKKIILILTAIAILAVVPFPVFAQGDSLPPDPSLSGDFTNQYMGERIIFDVAILRPLGFAATLVGAIAAVPVYPFAAASNSTDRVCRELLQRPYDYTFKRPVGDVDF